ncbi:MAG: sugar ABC transporter permease [Eubacteriales bacterium]|nr:sugar ABC transporter permease [Eubacteriales bacterium]
MKYLYTRRKCLLLVLPLFILYTMYTIYPMINSIYYSFTSYRGLGTPRWNDFANYRRLLTDRYVWLSLKNTLVAAVAMMLMTLPMSFVIAYNIKKRTLRNRIYLAAVFASYIVPGTLTALLWYFLLNPSFGMFNAILTKLGFSGVEWIGGLKLSPISYAMAASWANMGFYTCLWNVALTSIPMEILEASLIDGCNKWRQIGKIILPMIRENIGSMVILILTSALKIYELVYVLTGGGPNHASETIMSYMYTTTFTAQTYGYGMTIGVVEFTIAVIITMVSLAISRKER